MKVNADDAQVELAVFAPERLTVLPVTQAPAIVNEFMFDLYGAEAGVVITGVAGATVSRVHSKSVEAEVLPATSV